MRFPADDKQKNARLIVSQILKDAFESLKTGYPKSSPKRRGELLVIGKRLTKAD